MPIRARRRERVILNRCTLATPYIMHALWDALRWMNKPREKLDLQVNTPTMMHMLDTEEVQRYLNVRRSIGELAVGKLPKHLYGLKIVWNDEHPPFEFDVYDSESNNRVTVNVGYD